MVHRSPIRIARDYNRGLAPPVRWVHVAWAAAGRPVAELVAWCFDPERRFWAAPALLASVLIPLVLPWDPAISAAASGWVSKHLGGDITRELGAWQQYGGMTSIILTVALILILDRSKAWRLPDLVASVGFTALATTILKAFFGRPRPKYHDPFCFLWPGGEYPIARDGNPPFFVSALSPQARAELWSMPSSHTSAAAALSVFIIALYPPLRGVCAVLVCIVIIGRTMVGTDPAHWPSDVIAGACLGWIVGGASVRYSLGCRVAAWVASRGNHPQRDDVALRATAGADKFAGEDVARADG